MPAAPAAAHPMHAPRLLARLPALAPRATRAAPARPWVLHAPARRWALHAPAPRAAAAEPPVAPALGRALAGGLLGAAAATLVALAAPSAALALAPLPPAAPAAAAAPAAPRARAALLENKQPLPAPDAGLAPEELATIQVYRDRTPSIVNVANLQAVRSRYSTDVLNIPRGSGSGFVYAAPGGRPVIVTNAHVVAGAAEVRVTLIDQAVYRARLLGLDRQKDVAVLELVDAPPELLADLRPIPLGASSGLFVGQRVLAIGNPFGLDHTLTAGIVSGLNRELATGESGQMIKGAIQTDAAINPGNSGGPLLDSRGRLVGINTAIYSPSGASSGVGFAIPIDTVRGLVDQILEFGRVVRPALGVAIAPPQALRQLGIEGVMVMDAPAGGPAAGAGIRGLSRDAFGRLRVGDVIVGFKKPGGVMVPIRKDGDLFSALDECAVGDRVQLEILRGGADRETVGVTLAERAAAAE